MRETILIGDPHGCLDELLQLMDAIKFDHKTQRVIFLGDLLDRGRQSPECVWYVRDLCEKGMAECLVGNHENKHIRYRKHEKNKTLTGKPNPMRSMGKTDLEAHKRLSDEDIAWMASLPLTIHLKDDWYAIHGGLEPAYDFHKQSPNQIIRCRYVSNGKHTTSTGKIIPYGIAVALNPDKSQPENTFYWTEGWNGKQSIVFGHYVNSLTKPLIENRPNGVRCIGIDTGCVFGGMLTAFFLERDEFVQVKAKEKYYAIDAQFEE